MCKFTVACNRFFKKKGRGVRAVGRLKQDRWTDPDGKTEEEKPEETAGAEKTPAEAAEQEEEEVKEEASF